MGAQAKFDRKVDRSLEAIPVVENHASRGSQRVEPHERDVDVFTPVGLEAFSVIFLAVDLDCRNFLDDEIDSATIPHRALGDDTVPAGTKSRSSEALRERFAGCIHPVPDPPAFDREPQDEGFEVHSVQLTCTERPIDRGNRHLELLVQDDPLQGIDQADGVRSANTAIRPGRPMHDYPSRCAHVQPRVPVSLGSKPGRIRVDIDMQRMPSQNPPSAGGDSRDAGQPAANPHGAQLRAFFIERRIPPVSDANDIA